MVIGRSRKSQEPIKEYQGATTLKSPIPYYSRITLNERYLYPKFLKDKQALREEPLEVEAVAPLIEK